MNHKIEKLVALHEQRLTKPEKYAVPVQEINKTERKYRRRATENIPDLKIDGYWLQGDARKLPKLITV